MNDVLQKTADALRPYTGKKLAIGVSGGRDSMCLLHAVTHCGAMDKRDIIAVHVNHCLRETACRDERFVRAYCEENGIDFRSVSVDVRREAADKGLTVEQAARSLRYGVFHALIKSGEAEYILTAHHALDNAESVLMHMFRGAGLDGLRGMESGRTLRPFLNVYPDELDGYVREYGLEYVTDETNLDDTADRNFLRLRVMPLIEQRYRGAVRAINALAAECGETCDYLDGALDMSYITRDGDAVIVADAALNSPLAARYVRRALTAFTLTDVTRLQIQTVVALKSARMGAVAELAHGVKAAREYGGIALYIPREPCDTEAPFEVGTCFIDGLAVDVTASDADPHAVKGGAVDLDALRGAVIRFRRDGDVFTPFGGGTKKLKQYLIDKKLPARVRDRLPLVCRGNEVLVIVGLEISDKVKQTKDTKAKAVITRRY